jgi:hypothetical protein
VNVKPEASTADWPSGFSIVTSTDAGSATACVTTTSVSAFWKVTAGFIAPSRTVTRGSKPDPEMVILVPPVKTPRFG